MLLASHFRTVCHSESKRSTKYFIKTFNGFLINLNTKIAHNFYSLDPREIPILCTFSVWNGLLCDCDKKVVTKLYNDENLFCFVNCSNTEFFPSVNETVIFIFTEKKRFLFSMCKYVVADISQNGKQATAFWQFNWSWHEECRVLEMALKKSLVGNHLV